MRPTLEETIEFISERAPLAEKPFVGRRFPYHLVAQAVDILHDRGELQDLHVYDVHGTMNLWKKDGVVHETVTRQATKHLLQVLRKGRPITAVLSSVAKKDFDHQPLNKYGTTLAGMLVEVHHCAYDALRDLIEHDTLYGKYADFMPYDMRDAPKNTWVRNGRRNYALARTLTKQWLTRQGTPEEVVPRVTQLEFISTPANRYGTTLGGMVANVYGGSPYRALKDLFMHDDAYAAYRGLMPYDMGQVPLNTWKHRSIGRVATQEFFKAIGKPLLELLPVVDSSLLETTKINSFGTTVGRVLHQLYASSPYRMLMDLIDHDDAYAAFRDLRPYDMKVAPQNTWVRNGRRNLALAREATARLLQVVAQPRREDFMHTPINRYGTTLGGMLMIVYRNNVSRALEDQKSYK